MENSAEITGLVVDLDGTLAGDAIDGDYSTCPPNLDIIEKLNFLHKSGSKITIHTARSMRTYNRDIELITKNTLPIIVSWLSEHNVHYDEIVVGKPWPGPRGLYVDDRAVRPNELINMDHDSIISILEASRWRG